MTDSWHRTKALDRHIMIWKMNDSWYRTKTLDRHILNDLLDREPYKGQIVAFPHWIEIQTTRCIYGKKNIYIMMFVACVDIVM